MNLALFDSLLGAIWLVAGAIFIVSGFVNGNGFDVAGGAGFAAAGVFSLLRARTY